ncbi:DNA-binding SARP family transcriptional activator/tetratricopeptide (TPR) repeat protein [Actinoplanes lutulentus]|uniref:DNA-binding SARP family transcriptional activator n=1 Tax=Actinoplanes lutulentus TaxID=1287878 RepID=A0A327ZHN1_9ACTN|nr:BTAD domain-containing putative transcriptional regulator [Actinoplanes lutulentus]MBB2944310.1 DNA-binding SARP family transcriptional activator/tetratricopeptide (TPR) repeat protein [Actinoplanes lutulentus]RAK42457.1 DNA-binding SARP family transcriptional activator [Actinoplanes lutulentus]
MTEGELIRIGVLGPLDIRVGGRPVAAGGRQQQAVLAMLVAARGQVVPVDRIVEQLWDGTPPPRPLVSLQAYISRLRRVLEPRRAPRGTARVLVSEGIGYALRLPDEAVDAWAFEQDLRRVQEMRPMGLSAGAAEVALGILSAAMDRWRGEPYEPFADEPWAQPAIARLAEYRHSAQERITASLLVLGRTGEAVQAAQSLTEADRWRGQAWRLLAVALWAAHRSAEALDALRRHRRNLAEDLGLEPEPALAALEQAILEQRHETLAEELTFGVPPASTAVEKKPDKTDKTDFEVRPAQLPRSPATFSARQDQLAELTRLLDDADGSPLIVVSGAGGVGKTTLVVRWAHQVAGLFPDGQLYADLRGFSPEDAPASPADVLFGFLLALGVPEHRVPPGESERTALFRSVLAGRRMLLVLDNARDSEQVRPLLPGTGGCAVIVTSRSRLGGLVVTDGAATTHLDGFSDAEASDYLRGRLGDADPQARDAIVARCGGLPLALAVVCARAAGMSLTGVAAELAEEEGLDAFAVAGLEHDLRAVFSWSYRRLPEDAAALFRRLALHPGPDVSLPAAVSVTGAGRPRTRALLRLLRDAHLLDERRPNRFTYHDLVGGYAAEMAHRHDTPADRDAVLRRLVEHHLYSAAGAVGLLANPRPDRVGPVPERIEPETFADREAALTWMAGEYDNVLSIAEQCHESWGDGYLGPLVWTLAPYQQDLRFLAEDSFTLARRALKVAERDGEVWWVGFLNYILARGYLRLGRYEQARPYLERTIAVGRATGDTLRLAHGLLATAVSHIGINQVPSREDTVAAYPYALEAREHYRRIAHRNEARVEEANCLLAIAWYHFYQPGGQAETLRMLERSLAVQRDLSDARGTADVLLHLGRFRQATGDPAGAATDFTRALQLYRDMPDLQMEPLICLYSLYLATGDRAAAAPIRAELTGMVKTARYPDVNRLQALLAGAPE